MDFLQQTIKFCQENNIKPARSKGQNFLIRKSVYDKIIEKAFLSKSDVVVEVGPGLGFLTLEIASRVKQVTAIELDDVLAGLLSQKIHEKNINNVVIINEDILSDKYSLPDKHYRIIANLPYNITSRFLRKFLSELKNKPDSMVLLLQKEVAERLIAKPGQMSLLSVSAQLYADIKILFNVSKDAFWPKPKVDSAVVSLQVNKILKPSIDEEKFFALVRFGFAGKRKQLQRNLADNLHIDAVDVKKTLVKIGLDEKVRAQELSVEQWGALFVALNEKY